ncbi:unnamed protein product [Closterium sp. NIES-64]|nr:unnamed protein product [Closterium sp. NIES-64]
MAAQWLRHDKEGEPGAATRQQRRCSRRVGAKEGPEKLQMLSRADMLHYVDVRGAWDWQECECCFDRAVSYRAQLALRMVGLAGFRSLLLAHLPDSIPLVPFSQPASAIAEYSAGVHMKPLECSPPQPVFSVKCVVAPMRCAEAMIVEWMAEPRVGVLMDLGRIRSRLPAILAATNTGTTTGVPPATPVASAAASETWATRWAAYRRAVSFAAFLMLVARCPRVVNLRTVSLSTHSAAYPAIMQLGATRQIENDCFVSMLVQVLGVKESAELQEGFGFFVQHVLSGGLEKAHGEGRGGAEGGAAENAQGEEGRANGEVMDRGGGMEKEEQQGGDLARLIVTQVDTGGGKGRGDEGEPEHCSEASRGEEMHSREENNAAAGEGGSGGKNGQWRENLKGRVWESHCSEEGGSNTGSDVQLNGIPKGMYVSGVSATDFALALAAELSKPEKCIEAVLYVLDGNNANKGDEAAAKLPDDPDARFFQLGIVEESSMGVECGQRVTEQDSKFGRKHVREKGRKAKASGKGSDVRGGDTNRGFGEDQGGISHASGMTVARPPLRGEVPMVGCVEDAEFIVDAISLVASPLACAKCIRCYRSYTSFIPSIALDAKFAYRPLSVLVNRFLSVFPPHSAGFDKLVKAMGLSPFPPGPPALANLARLRGEIEAERLGFFMFVALTWPASILDMEHFESKRAEEGDGIRVKKRVGRKKGKARGEEEEEDDGEVWEELQSWCYTAKVAWPSAMRLALSNSNVESARSGLSGVCTGSEGRQKRAHVDTRMANIVNTGAAKRIRQRVRDRAWAAWRSSTSNSSSDAVMWIGAAAGTGSASNGSSGRESGDGAGTSDIACAGDGASGVAGAGGGAGGGAGAGAGVDGSKSTRGKGKKLELPPYQIPWPGGVNLVACLREMLLGEPCYRHASPAAASVPPSVANTTAAAPNTTASASSIPAAPTNVAAPSTAVSSTHPPVHTVATTSTHDASSTHVTPTNGAATGTAAAPAPVADAKAFGPDACRGSRCGAAGCASLEGGGVKLRSCGGCGKVAYCSRDCQKAHWPSHKLTCPGRTSRKRSANVSCETVASKGA